MAYTSNTATAAQQAASESTAPVGQGVNLNQAGPSPQSPSNEWDWATEGLALPVTLASTSEVVSKLEAALALIIKPVANQEVRLLSIDNTVETNWRYSVAVFCVHRPGVNWLSYYPMLIEATEARPLEGRAVRLGQSDRQVTVMPVPSDALDAAYVGRIEELLAANYPGAQALHVQGTSIPKTVNFDDVDTLKRILLLAARSCVTQLAEIDPSFVDNNLSTLRRRDGSSAPTVSRMAVTSGSVNGDVRNTVGLPIRQDIELTLVAVQPQTDSVQGQTQIAQAHSLNGTGATEERIGKVSAYLDVRMLPSMPNLYNQDPMALTRRFVPELVITGVELSKLATTASLMMMVGQMTALAEPRVWHSVMYQRTIAGRADYRNAAFDPTDIGVLNYVSNIAREATPSIYDLKSSNIGPAEFIDYVNRVFTQGLAISIDVPRLAPQAAYMNVLSNCAYGKKESLDFLLSSLNKLTGGNFSRVFFAQTGGVGSLTSEMVFSEANNSIYNGYYSQKIGDVTRDVDLRHVDTIALLARFGQQNPEMVTKWAQSYMVKHIDPAIRMANKREVIDAYTNDSATITGISERHTFRTEFLKAIVECNIQNGFTPVLEFRDPLAGADTGLHAPAFMQNGLWQGGVAGAFASNGGQPGAGAFGGVYHNPTASRF